MNHLWGCDYPDGECYCPMPGETRRSACGCLVDACCDCAEG